MIPIELYGKLFLNQEHIPKIKFEDPSLSEQVMKDLLKSKDECNIKITIEPIKELKTTQQLRYYFGVVIKYVTMWMVEQGNNVTQYEVDMFLRDQFYSSNIAGVKIPKDLSTISKDDMINYLNKIEVWRNTLDIYIPIQTT